MNDYQRFHDKLVDDIEKKERKVKHKTVKQIFDLKVKKVKKI